MISNELKELLKLSGGKVIVDEGKIVVMKLEDYLAEMKQMAGKIDEHMDEHFEAEFEEEDDDGEFGADDLNELERQLEENGSGETGDDKVTDCFSEKEKDVHLTDQDILNRMESDLDELRQRLSEEAVESLELETKDIRYEGI